MRARDLGVTIGLLPPGPLNAITDVAGVRVGHATLIRGDAGPLRVGEGPVRTGVTVIVPHAGDLWREAVFAGCHRLNGNGELTGLEWIREAGLLAGPIGLTNTHSVGTVRDAIIAAATRDRAGDIFWALPVVGETWDGWLNDIDGQHVRPEHVFAALAAASGGSVAQGNVGGGTGMICHEFKGGIGTASRVLPARDGGFTVGALVQANHGGRSRLAMDGVPIGREITVEEVPSAWHEAPRQAGSGSIIVVLATDAPLLPHQCERLAQRAGLGVARSGGGGENSSGDLFLAFATGNGSLALSEAEDAPLTRNLVALDDAHISPLFWAAIEATEEAIANALVAAQTLTGRDGHSAPAIPHERVREIFARHRDAGRQPESQ
jgi:D-aminopeptidase